MITIAIIGLVVMGAILGYAFRGQPDNYCPHWDYDIKAGKLSNLETRVFILEKDNERLNYIINSHGGMVRMFEENYYAHCYRCDKTFWSKDEKGQKVADELKKITLSTEEIARKLDIKIPSDLRPPYLQRDV